MSNKIKLNNLLVLQEMHALNKANQNTVLGEERVSHDFAQFEKKKNEVNKELIKLQQKMKSIVTTKKDRYIELAFFEFTKVVLVEET